MPSPPIISPLSHPLPNTHFNFRFFSSLIFVPSLLSANPSSSAFFHFSQQNLRKSTPPMSSEMVMVDEIPFPPTITTTKPLTLLGHGITDIEIHFLQIKFTAIGVYLEPEIVGHLQQWKGKTGKELTQDDLFFESLISAPVEKFLRIVVIKEIKGSQYGVQLESAVRDRLAAIDKYEEEEEEALEKVVEFFQSKYFKRNSVVTFHFPAASHTAEIGFVTEGKEEVKTKVENANVVEMIKKWYLGGSRAVSETTVASLASGLEALLSQ
ncbi:chalcone-flavanone isomerase family protein [Tasmannia lanceolata]|uniref:chalcone-flavanone isomerase family protein n=1 Tax=Tasmannia lanceolata TaxID=3420 RepID=UPI004062CD6C